MAQFKEEKTAELIRSLAAEFLERESNRTSLITVTRIMMGDKLKKSTIYFTVLPESQEEQALSFARRQLSDFRNFVKEKAKLRQIPFFEFEIDKGEKNRQMIDELGKSL